MDPHNNFVKLCVELHNSHIALGFFFREVEFLIEEKQALEQRLDALVKQRNKMKYVIMNVHATSYPGIFRPYADVHDCICTLWLLSITNP